jgi:hypothetical protein
MKPERQLIVIAEACGITIPEHWRGDARNEASFLRFIPDYLNDLNAMHVAEAILKEGQMLRYGRFLKRIVTGEKTMHHNYTTTASIARATAAQRAEALLRTLGIWEEAA